MDVSVVVPVYGCVESIRELVARVSETLANQEHEVVLVVDGPSDDSWQVVNELAADYPVKGLRLSRNFGQHQAITAGMAEATGELVVVMDCDLQDPPEDIQALLQALEPDVDLVMVHRVGEYDSRRRRLVARMYASILNWFFGVEIDSRVSTLSILRRPVVEAFLSVGDVNRQYRMILDWLGFRRVVIDLPRHRRASGESSYTFGKKLRIALEGILFAGARPLWIFVGIGFLMAIVGFVATVVIVITRLTSDLAPGWASLFSLSLVIGGLLIALVSIVGLYVGRVFDQTRGRPLYVIAERCN